MGILLFIPSALAMAVVTYASLGIATGADLYSGWMCHVTLWTSHSVHIVTLTVCHFCIHSTLLQTSSSSLIYTLSTASTMVLVANLVSQSLLSWSSTKVSKSMESSSVHSRMLPFCFLQRGVVAVAILTMLVVQTVSPEMASETPRSGSCRRSPRSQASTVHHQKHVAYNSTSLLHPCWQLGASCRCCVRMCPILDSPLSSIAFNFRFISLLVSLICNTLCTA